MSRASPTAAPGCLLIVQVAEVLGVVERAVGQVAAVERWCRPATAAGWRPGRRRAASVLAAEAAVGPHGCATLSHRFHNTHRKTQDRRGPLIWRVS